MSGGNKAIELQLQMRQNAEDLQSFMKELESWEEDIKRKDDELRTGGGGQEGQVRPPGGLPIPVLAEIKVICGW